MLYPWLLQPLTGFHCNLVKSKRRPTEIPAFYLLALLHPTLPLFTHTCFMLDASLAIGIVYWAICNHYWFEYYNHVHLELNAISGWTYFFLLMFIYLFFYLPQHLQAPLAVRCETLPHDRNLGALCNACPKIWGLPGD